MDMKTLTEELFMNKMLPRLKPTMLTQPEPMIKQSINSQILPKKNSLPPIWPFKCQRDGNQVNSLLRQTKNQTIQSIGVHKSMLRIKEAVVHAGHSPQLEQLKPSKRLLRESQSVYQNNNWLTVIRLVVAKDAMEVILTLHSNGPLPMDSKQKLLIHTLVRMEVARPPREPNTQQVFPQYQLLHWRLPSRSTQFQSLLMPQIGVLPQDKEFIVTVLNHWTTLSSLSDMMLMEIGSSRIHGEQLGELRDSSLSQLEILVVSPNMPTKLSEVFYLHHNNTKINLFHKVFKYLCRAFFCNPLFTKWVKWGHTFSISLKYIFTCFNPIDFPKY